MKPHLPFYAPKKYWDLHEREKIEIAGNRYRPENAPNNLKASGEFRSYHLADFNEKSDDFDRIIVIYNDNQFPGITVVFSEPLAQDPTRDHWTRMNITHEDLGLWEATYDEPR